MSKPTAKGKRKAEKIQAVVSGPPAGVGRPSIPAEWDELCQGLGVDLEQLAVETKALQRKRQVRCAQDLLRIVLAYALWDWSLQLVGAWATLLGLGRLSAVAIRQRLRRSQGWLSRLLGEWLRPASQPLTNRPVRLRLIDASVISRPGSTGTDWRVHVSFDVGALRLDEFELTDAQGGESLLRHAATGGDLIVADRGYAHRAGLGHLLAAGAQVVVRLNGHDLPLETAAGDRLDVRRWLQRLPAAQRQQTRVVWLTTPHGRFQLRLIARRLPPAAATAARRRAAHKSKKNGRRLSARTRLLAQWVMLVSNLPSEAWSPSQLLALYRVRWQVELLIKRCKSVLGLGQLRARDRQLAQVYLLGKAVGTLLVQEGLRPQLDTLAEWFDDVDRPLSLWRWTAFWWEQLRAVVRGHVTGDRLQAALPQLARYLCDAPRKRRQHLALTRPWLRKLDPNLAHPTPTLPLAYAQS